MPCPGALPLLHELLAFTSILFPKAMRCAARDRRSLGYLMKGLQFFEPNSRIYCYFPPLA